MSIVWATLPRWNVFQVQSRGVGNRSRDEERENQGRQRCWRLLSSLEPVRFHGGTHGTGAQYVHAAGVETVFPQGKVPNCKTDCESCFKMLRCILQNMCCRLSNQLTDALWKVYDKVGDVQYNEGFYKQLFTRGYFRQQKWFFHGNEGKSLSSAQSQTVYADFCLRSSLFFLKGPSPVLHTFLLFN